MSTLTAMVLELWTLETQKMYAFPLSAYILGSRDGFPLKSDWIIDAYVILELLPVVSVPRVLPSFSVFCVRFERRASANWLELVKTTPLP
jgi:hypothetical protein